MTPNPPQQTIVAHHLLINGKVQGVNYRWNMLDRAHALGIYGWCKNLPDGRVEAWVQGESSNVEALERWAQDGPSFAVVDSVQSEEVSPDPSLKEFMIYR